ncbi:uncharacterized protein LOC119475586 [Sebastes umbrosus]|uniref:uncharacterized protein LOC119475586 n=1 Tax=Sebastes umbrosus TaxID=72105 RepID=UPI00189E627E|nr:uncharacterized protein LOC119475586 [Sebastes umbrosus]
MMLNSPGCNTCMAPLQPEDGHDLCPSCLVKSLLLALHSSAGTEDAGTPTPPMAESYSEEDAVSMAASELDIRQPESTPASAFFRRAPASTTFTVPPSKEYLRELQACWRDTRAFSRLPSDGRTLAAMQDAAKFGLDHMPAIEPAIASLIVSPDEALRPEARCPRPQCRVTDDLLSKAYDTAARMGRMGNSLSHLMLALSASLQEAAPDVSSTSLSDASLQAFALMSRELGRLMSMLVQTRRQVWLAQSPLSETCRRTLRTVPVEPGHLFGTAALQVLERTVQADQTRQQFSGLRRGMPPPARLRGSMSAPRGRSRPPAQPSGHHGPQRPTERQVRYRDNPAHLPSRQPWAVEPNRRPPRAFRGRGARY